MSSFKDSESIEVVKLDQPNPDKPFRLPDEIWEQILEADTLFMPELGSAALICRAAFRVLEPRLVDHRYLCARFKRLGCSRDGRTVSSRHLITDALQLLWSWDAIYYLRHFTMPRNLRPSGVVLTDADTELVDEVNEDFTWTSTVAEITYPEELDVPIAFTDTEFAILLFVVLSAPNLEVLDLSSNSCECIRLTLQLAIAAKHIVSNNYEGHKGPLFEPLRSLRHINYDHLLVLNMMNDYELTDHMTALSAVRSLQSMVMPWTSHSVHRSTMASLPKSPAQKVILGGWRPPKADILDFAIAFEGKCVIRAPPPFDDEEDTILDKDLDYRWVVKLVLGAERGQEGDERVVVASVV